MGTASIKPKSLPANPALLFYNRKGRRDNHHSLLDQRLHDSSLFQYNLEGELKNLYMSNSEAGPIQNKLLFRRTGKNSKNE